jgi:hypothetical protein
LAAFSPRWQVSGVVASLDLFLDDIFPDTIGKPIVSQDPAHVHQEPDDDTHFHDRARRFARAHLRSNDRFRPR